MMRSLPFLPSLFAAICLFAAGCQESVSPGPTGPGARLRERLRATAAAELAEPRGDESDQVFSGTAVDGHRGFVATPVTSFAIAQAAPAGIAQGLGADSVDESPDEPQTSSENPGFQERMSPEKCGIPKEPASDEAPVDPNLMLGRLAPNSGDSFRPPDCPNGRCPISAPATPGDPKTEPTRDAQGRIVFKFCYQTLDGVWHLNEGRFPEPVVLRPLPNRQEQR